MNIVIVTDAWYPQINGVVRTLERTRDELVRLGHAVTMVAPDRFRTLPCPTYPEIRLSLFPNTKLRAMLTAAEPDALHIATEGPLGLAARAWALKKGFPFTTSFHTQFPEYVKLRTGIPLGLSYRFMRWFHGPAATVMVATPTLKRNLEKWGFTNLGMWSRGVNTELFRPRGKFHGDDLGQRQSESGANPERDEPKPFLDGNRPIFLYMGRVAVEKNIEAFLKLDLPGTKYVVGGGPDLDMLRRKYPAARFTGYKTGEELARHMATADVFVFPSLTDTFGLVLIEALACGVPVAAFPVQGPIDIVENGVTGCLDENLETAAMKALQIDPERCRRQALLYTWEACTRQFLTHLEAARPSRERALAAS